MPLVSGGPFDLFLDGIVPNTALTVRAAAQTEHSPGAHNLVVPNSPTRGANMKKLVALMLLVVALPAYAMTYFLVAQWYERGSQMCKYGNGTVLNVGANVCPLSVQG